MTGAGHADALGLLARRIARQVRRRRAEHHALRGLFYGALAGVAALALKSVLGPRAVTVAVAAVVAGIVIGGLWGLTRRVASLEAARLVDRHFGLQDRVSTALEWADRPDRTPLVEALIADSAERVRALEPRRVVRRIWPREASWLPLPAVALLALVLAPAIPLPSGFLPDMTPSGEDEEALDRPQAGTLEEARRAEPRNPRRSAAFEERDWMQRGASGASPTAGDLSAIFKDTAIASQRPDFNSFLKKGDERLKLLEQVDRLPNLQADFTTSQYKMIFRKSKALTAGLRPDQISPEKLRELEMQRLGRKDGGDWGSDVAEGMEALEYGEQDRALEAMEKALNKLRAMEEAQRAGKSLRGGREPDQRQASRDGSGGADGMDDEFGEGEGLLPGKGTSPQAKGDPTQRLQAQPYDVGVEGESRKGRKDAYDTNMTGRGGKMGSRLGYLGVIGQYRKSMEDALAREQVPRDYHDQIRDYFQSLDER